MITRGNRKILDFDTHVMISRHFEQENYFHLAQIYGFTSTGKIKEFLFDIGLNNDESWEFEKLVLEIHKKDKNPTWRKYIRKYKYYRNPDHEKLNADN